MSKRGIAILAESNASGVSRAIDALVDNGVVVPVGAGARRLYMLSTAHQLSKVIVQLFEEEQLGFKKLITTIQSVASSLEPPPIAVWIQGGVVTKTDQHGETLVIGVLGSSTTIDKTAEQFQERVTSIEQEYDVTIHVQGMTKADYTLLSKEDKTILENTTPLLGPPVLDILVRNRNQKHKEGMTHTHHEDKSLVVSSIIAGKFDAEPQIIEKAKEYIDDHLKTCSAREQKELIEWKRILQSMSIPRLKRFLVDDSERAIRLRQSSPFVGALSQDELEEIRESK